jgi:hypothetical protein
MTWQMGKVMVTNLYGGFRTRHGESSGTFSSTFRGMGRDVGVYT